MVVIKGFYMPQSCAQCDFLDNYGYCLALNGEFRVDRRCTRKRDENCPLTELESTDELLTFIKSELTYDDIIALKVLLDNQIEMLKKS